MANVTLPQLFAEAARVASTYPLARSWFAMTARGAQCMPEAADAVCFCTIGYARRAMQNLGVPLVDEANGKLSPLYRQAMTAIADRIEPGRNRAREDDIWIINWSDRPGRTAPEVVGVFKELAA